MYCCLQKTSERDFMIDWKDNFLSYLKTSKYYTGSAEDTKHTHSRLFLESSVRIEKYDSFCLLGRFCPKKVFWMFITVSFIIKQQVENGAFNWAMMPAELRPNWKRKQHLKEASRKLAKDVNIEETLKALEQKEKNKKVDGAPNEDKDSENVWYQKMSRE